ncbi:MAG: hypothetical protein ACHQHN_19255 [Sphingobacteriales bacterium]|jgi:hypothetical protein
MTDLINEILLGGLLGILGQGIRIIVGLKKLHTSNVSKALNDDATDSFSSSRLLLSIFIGFIAGALALIIKGTGTIDRNLIIIIMAAGYSGADFIEGVFHTYISKLDRPSEKSNDNQDNSQPLKVADESLTRNSQSTD